jgi:hypothetical protein
MQTGLLLALSLAQLLILMTAAKLVPTDEGCVDPKGLQACVKETDASFTQRALKCNETAAATGGTISEGDCLNQLNNWQNAAYLGCSIQGCWNKVCIYPSYLRPYLRCMQMMLDAQRTRSPGSSSYRRLMSTCLNRFMAAPINFLWFNTSLNLECSALSVIPSCRPRPRLLVPAVSIFKPPGGIVLPVIVHLTHCPLYIYWAKLYHQGTFSRAVRSILV